MITHTYSSLMSNRCPCILDNQCSYIYIFISLFQNIYEEVMKMDRFEETMLAFAFNNLNGDEKKTWSFMLKNDKLRKQWQQNFFDNYLSQF